MNVGRMFAVMAVAMLIGVALLARSGEWQPAVAAAVLACEAAYYLGRLAEQDKHDQGSGGGG